MEKDIFQKMGITNNKTIDELDNIIDKWSHLYKKN